jgi:integrase
VYLFRSLRSVNRPTSDNTINGALRRMSYGKDEMTAHGFRPMAATLLKASLKGLKFPFGSSLLPEATTIRPSLLGSGMTGTRKICRPLPSSGL